MKRKQHDLHGEGPDYRYSGIDLILEASFNRTLYAAGAFFIYSSSTPWHRSFIFALIKKIVKPMQVAVFHLLKV